jgi:hypothetical protein
LCFQFRIVSQLRQPFEKQKTKQKIKQKKNGSTTIFVKTVITTTFEAVLKATIGTSNVPQIQLGR